MSLKVRLNFQTPPADYHYAVEVVLGRNVWPVMIGTIADKVTPANILTYVQDVVEWELHRQETQYTTIDWTVNEVAE